MAWAAVQQTRKVWRYRGLVMTALPSRPRAGQPVEVTLVLPPARRSTRLLANSSCAWRNTVDEASSGSPERRVQTLEAGTRRLALGDGHLRLVARFSCQTMLLPMVPSAVASAWTGGWSCWGPRADWAGL